MLRVCQGVIDGDLCEQYNSMDVARKKSIADELDRAPSEVRCLHNNTNYYILVSRLVWNIHVLRFQRSWKTCVHDMLSELLDLLSLKYLIL